LALQIGAMPILLNNNKIYYNPKIYPWIFLFAFIGICLYYHFIEITALRPSGFHVWRQCDCLSVALNYYQNGMDFFRPSIHNLLADGCTSGYSASEFPLIYFFVALLWKIFGYHEYIFRLVVLFIVFFGFRALYRSLEDILHDSFFAAGLALLIYTSPIIVYYSNNFLSNMPAFSFAIIGCHYSWRFIQHGRNKVLWVAAFFFLLAGLLKVSALLSFFLLMFIFLADSTGLIKFKAGNRIFRQPLKQLIPFLVVIILIATWYLYAMWFNQHHNGYATLLGLFPIWEADAASVNRIWDSFVTFLLRQEFSMAMLLVSLAVFVTMLFLGLFKKINRKLILLLIILLIATLAYFLMWFQAFDIHDYYMIDFIMVIILLYTIFFNYLKTQLPKISGHFIFRIVFIAFLVYNAKYVHNNLHLRLFCERCPTEQYVRYTTPYEVGCWWWFSNFNTKNSGQFHYISPYLDSIGVAKDDKVISLPDISPNVSLALMNRTGWSGYGLTDLSGEARIDSMKKWGARYLFISDSSEFRETYLTKYTANKVGTYKNVNIYKL
jgi:hypothetical protein